MIDKKNSTFEKLYLRKLKFLCKQCELMKVIIAGGRDFANLELMTKKMDFFLSKATHMNIEIVSGKARGADALGEEYAKLRNYPIAEFPADWDKYNKGSGFRRNTEMAEYADALVAFWDGKSRGTMHMINVAKKKGLQVKVVEYTPVHTQSRGHIKGI